MSIWQTGKQLASLWAETKLTQLELRGKPQTKSDSGGSIDSYSFAGQEIDQSDLRKVKEIRESGGVVAQLVHAKALMKFGTGAQLQSDDDDLEEWLADAFGRRLDDVILDLGEDALWYPYGLGEAVPLPAGDGFSHVELIEPWTMLPDQDDFGDITRWVQEVDNSKRSFPTDEIGSVVLNKRSGRDKVGLSEVLRSEDEITQFKDNQQAINKAIEIAGFPHHVWTVGAEGKSPVSDNDLRRVRNLIDDMDGDTQFVVGPDVDHDKITPGEFDFGAITERDLRMLTASLGLPFELVGYGSDGLGSGHEADLKMNLLAIQNEADRRRFADQFVEQFVEPVVERFSPHSADAEITLQIDPFLDDKQDMAEWIGQVGSYMRNQDVAEKLDLPPIEDDDLASAYRPPQQIEEGEEGDGQPGMDADAGGFFSAVGQERVMQGVPDNAVSITDPSDAPEGANVIEGPGGGLYYVPGGGGGGAPDGDGDTGPTGEDGEPPASVDLENEVDSMSLEDAGITGGGNNPNMRISQLEDGSEVFVEEEPHPLLAEAAVTGAETYDALGVPVPDHYYDEETGELAKESIDGHTIRDIHLEEQDVDVDEESVVDAFAASLIAGETDMHAGNMMVDEEGQAVPIDIDGSGGITTDPSSQQQKIEQNLDMLDTDATFEDVADRVEEMAADAELGDLEGEYADQIRENAEVLAA